MIVINEYILTLSTGNTVTSTADHMDSGKVSDHQLRYNVCMYVKMYVKKIFTGGMDFFWNHSLVFTFKLMTSQVVQRA